MRQMARNVFAYGVALSHQMTLMAWSMHGGCVVKKNVVSSDDGVCLSHGVSSLASDGLYDDDVRNGRLGMCRDGWSANVWLVDVENGEGQSELCAQ